MLRKEPREIGLADQQVALQDAVGQEARDAELDRRAAVRELELLPDAAVEPQAVHRRVLVEHDGHRLIGGRSGDRAAATDWPVPRATVRRWPTSQSGGLRVVEMTDEIRRHAQHSRLRGLIEVAATRVVARLAGAATGSSCRSSCAASSANRSSRPAAELRSSIIGSELSASRSKPPTPSSLGPRRNELTATIRNAADAMRAIVAMLRPTLRPALRTASRQRTAPANAVLPPPAAAERAGDHQQQRHEHQRAGAEKRAGLRFAAEPRRQHGQRDRSRQQPTAKQPRSPLAVARASYLSMSDPRSSPSRPSARRTATCRKPRRLSQIVIAETTSPARKPTIRLIGRRLTWA